MSITRHDLTSHPTRERLNTLLIQTFEHDALVRSVQIELHAHDLVLFRSAVGGDSHAIDATGVVIVWRQVQHLPDIPRVLAKT
jgi:hypothetical protein